MIQIKELAVQVVNTQEQIISNISMSFKAWNNYCLLWKNGSWKSTLSAVLAGSPKYEISNGNITIDGEDLSEMSPEERSQRGIFLSFQNVPEIPW